jgi:hypothetical protein
MQILGFAPCRGSPLGVKSVALFNRRLPVDVHYTPSATEIARRCNMSRRANTGSVASFDHLVGELLEVRWHIDTDCRGSFEVDH